MTLEIANSHTVKFGFDVEIAAPQDTVWTLLTQRVNNWWMEDYRALGAGSKMSLNAKTGGSLVEVSADGDSLEWYRVQMVQSGVALYLVGYMAPDWGGPTLSMLKLGLKSQDGKTLFSVTDGLMGNVSKASAKTAMSGWQSLFAEGFKNFVASS